MNSKSVEITHWKDYELIDSGNFEKLERFGNKVVLRPEPQAIWSPAMKRNEWQNKADYIFQKDKQNAEKGEWILKSKSSEKWIVQHQIEGKKIQFNLRLTSFKHVGLFPEQSDNWHFIYNACKRRSQPKVLNLFAYTGGASLAAKLGGADTFHVEAVRKVVSWANENQELSGLEDIRWVVDDALSFCKRKANSGQKFDGIILDPPAYGRGPKGEKWILEEHLPILLSYCAKMLETNGFVVLNLYSMGFSPLIAANVLQQYFNADAACGEHYFSDNYKHILPLGSFARFDKLV